MNLQKTLLLSLALLAPATAAYAEIHEDGPGDDGGGGGGGGGGGSDDAPPTWRKDYLKTGYWGIDDWGAGYRINGAVWAMPEWDDYKDRLGANASAEAYTRLNGSQYRLFRATASGSTEAKRKTTATFKAYIASATVYNETWTSQSSTYTFLDESPDPWTPVFLDKSIPVSVVGIPVTFRARSTGNFAASVTGKVSNVGVEATAGASAGAWLYLSAAIGGTYCFPIGGCVGASAGVYSDVKLIQAAAPAKVAAWWSLARTGGVLINYEADATATLSSLDGEAGVFAEACLGWCKRGELELFDWSGISRSYTLADFSGTHCLAGNCGPAFPGNETPQNTP